MIQLFSPTIRRKEMDAVLTCLVDEKIGPGDINARLVSEVKKFIGCEGALALRSPEIALYYSLKALNLPKDSLVLISALAPSWHSIALERLGYKVMPLDVDETTGVISVAEAKRGVLAGGKLFLIHETFGIAPDLVQICSLGLPVIEDISHSAGASLENKKYGMHGVFSIWGLEEDDIVTSGGGALLLAPSQSAWTSLSSIKVPKIDILPDLNCSLGFIGLKEYKRNEEVRQKIYQLYAKAIMQAGRHKIFFRDVDEISTIHSFNIILSGDVKECISYADRKEIEVKLAYENTVIALDRASLTETCPVASSLCLRSIRFPLYPRLKASQIDSIVKVLSTLP